jgi:hypothetical protein
MTKALRVITSKNIAQVASNNCVADMLAGTHAVTEAGSVPIFDDVAEKAAKNGRKSRTLAPSNTPPIIMKNITFSVRRGANL